MSSSFQLTPFKDVFPNIEHLSYALEEFAKKPRDPEVSQTVENLCTLMETQMKDLRDDVSFNPQHAMVFKSIYNSIKRLHTVEHSTVNKIENVISFIIQSRLPLELPEVNNTDQSIFILTSQLNDCFNFLEKSQNIEANLKFAARILVVHYRLFKGLELSGKTPLNDLQKNNAKMILNSCEEGMRVLAKKVPAVRSHPFFKSLSKLIFNRLETQNWNTRLPNDISTKILSFLPNDIGSENIILEFNTQNPKERFQVLAEWINNNKIPLAKMSIDPQELKFLQPYLRFVDLCNFDFSNWNETQIQVFIQNCVKIETLKIDTDKITSLPLRVQQLKHLHCLCENLTKLPEKMIHLLELTSLSSTILPDGMKTLRSLKIYGEDNNFEDILDKMNALPEGLISVQQLDCLCWKTLTTLTNDLYSLKKLTLRRCKNFSTIPNYIKTHLTVLFVDNTAVTSLPQGMNLLKVLDCTNTNISVFPQGMTSLTVFSCWGCSLTNMLPDDLVSLKHLYLRPVHDIYVPAKYIPRIDLECREMSDDLVLNDVLDINGNLILNPS